MNVFGERVGRNSYRVTRKSEPDRVSDIYRRTTECYKWRIALCCGFRCVFVGCLRGIWRKPYRVPPYGITQNRPWQTQRWSFRYEWSGSRDVNNLGYDD